MTEVIQEVRNDVSINAITDEVEIEEDPTVVEVSQLVNSVVIVETPPDRVILASPVAVTVGGGSGSGTVLGDPLSQYFLTANLPAGGSQALDCDPITNGLQGRLWQVDCGSSVALRIDIEKITAGPLRTIVATIYKDPVDSDDWRPPDPRFTQLLGDGVAKYGLTITNLDPYETSDVRSTVYWDELGV